MERVEIYTSPLCGYCHAAKRLLRKNGVTFSEYDVMSSPARKKEMLVRSDGKKTVSQIFINGVSIGGFDELTYLDLHDVSDGHPMADRKYQKYD